MSHAIISAGTHLVAGRSKSAATPSSFIHPTSSPHRVTFTSRAGNFPLRFRRPINPIRASATAAASGSSLYVSTESFYDLLGIPVTGTVPEIKQAYRQLARKYHPDVSPPEKAEEHTKQFLRVQEAYETLTDPMSRAQYDRDLASGFHLGFSARKQFDKGMDSKEGWKQRWESQIEQLQKQSNWKQSNRSWGERMRRHRGSSEFSFN